MLKWFCLVISVVFLGLCIYAASTGHVSSDSTEYKKLDYSKPIFTDDGTIVCPYSTLLDTRYDHGPDAVFRVFTSFSLHRTENARALGCEVLTGGIRVFAHRMKAPFDLYVAINFSPGEPSHLFTMEGNLKNGDVIANDDPSVPASTTARLPDQSTPVDIAAPEQTPVEGADSEQYSESSPNTDVVAQKQGQEVATDTAKGKGTPLPPIHNSSDTHCAFSQQCTDAEFADVLEGLQKQWAITPEWLRKECLSNSTYPSMESCILNRTVSWANEHPGVDAPWVNLDNMVQLTKATEERKK